MLRNFSQRTVARVQYQRCFAEKTVVEKVQEKAGQAMEKVGKMFESDGKVGEKFEKDGKVGGKIDKETSPNSKLDSEGSVGSKFKSDGEVGGKVEEAAQEVERKGQNLKKKAQS
mmetsp:Transcript_18919/g.57152  ORF Transcript_18919/g.57152 Transcript_18919/m.57152 type:complete len:114 (-) Transcript_18919:721-1062(-)|eukprot:CAMPEP_0206148746 /NCGR_PEP_ID=MMETSP1473-20131121/37414_1 /ASSEMBLY_ACC=CAM_ASM_001109 /TAXON_ID=1461547 /ORGANISM="Stichococcus sp, Strain RCC1054" /LENGTH=113 /DNA_ID=CAMNT_0053546169 /DNA_START=120 /DNA_END=461 /DNA_ORIENTATION=+